MTLEQPKPAADYMWLLVPAFARYRDEQNGNGHLHALIEALAVGVDAARSDVRRLLDDMFVETCDARLVPLIGDLVGVSVDPEIPVSRQRHQVKHALRGRRERGSVAQLELLGWQLTGFPTRVHEAPSTQRTIWDPRESARVLGDSLVRPQTRAVDVTQRIPPGRIDFELRVAWPVQRTQCLLTAVDMPKLGADVHAVDLKRDVGLRRADGTAIFRGDDAGDLVGPDREIEVELIGADASRLGPLRAFFTTLADGATPYVPDHGIAIDPERGRVAGPTGPSPGIRAYRQYRLHFWRPQLGERVDGSPALQASGVYTFASDGALDGLTDEDGMRLLVMFEGERHVRQPGPGERLLVVRNLSHGSHDGRLAPFVLLPAETTLAEGPVEEQGMLLDAAGLNRLFSIEDECAWDLMHHVRLVTRLSKEPLPEDTVEVDVARGRFRLPHGYAEGGLRVRFHRRYALTAIKQRAVRGLRAAVPLGRTPHFVFRDTAPGRTEELSP